MVWGPSGTGKTLLLEALGEPAVEQWLRVAWFTTEGLGALLRRRRAENTVTKAIAAVRRADLVIFDDVGLLLAAADAAYQKRSVAISSNLHASGFDELMPKTLANANANADRLPHHAHLCQASTDIVRLTQALAGQLDMSCRPVVANSGWADPMATTGQFSRRSPGRPHDRPWALPTGFDNHRWIEANGKCMGSPMGEASVGVGSQ